jgi:predicted ATP-grasp superfamily ATP-dependent carboligase
VEYIATTLEMESLAEIDPGPFRIYNFPGSMEVSALFRPMTEIEDGIILTYDEPANSFYIDAAQRLVVFQGREPHLQWRRFADALLEVMNACDVREVCFVGSVAGLVPHTRAPRFRGTVSHEDLLDTLAEHGIAPTNYEGPASFATHLSLRCRERGIRMLSAVAEVPAYIQGRNESCIQAAIEKVRDLYALKLDTSPLRRRSMLFQKRLRETTLERPDFLEQLQRMEDEYDREALSDRHDELREWFERQDIRLD